MNDLDVQVLVFDLDNTLLLRDEAMLHCIENLFKVQLSVAQKKAIQLKDAQGHSDRIVFCEWLRIYLELSVPASTIWSKIKENIGFFVKLNKGVIPMLKQLKSQYELVLLTNGGTSNQQRKIRQTGLDRFFTTDKTFISESIGFSKPDPRAFQIIQNQFKTKCSFCMVGDHWEKDILGALHFGWKAIYVNRENHLNRELFLSSRLKKYQLASARIIPSISSLIT